MLLEDLEKKIAKYKENKKLLADLEKIKDSNITGLHLRSENNLQPNYFETSQFQMKHKEEIINFLVSDTQEYKSQLQKEIAEFEALLLAIDKIVIFE